MFKNISKLLLLPFLFLVLALPARAGVQEAVSYLQTQNQDDWVIMALQAAGAYPDGAPLQNFSGTLATDYAKRILAAVALNQNPSTFTNVDLVADLLNMAQAGQLGDPDLLNDDAWGILALRAAGVPASTSVIADAASYLVFHQQPDGGWSWSASFTSDTNDTAAVTMALLEAGYSSSDVVIQDAIQYLKSTQKPDGGWAYEPIWDSDTASTAWVITALTKLGQNLSDWGNPDEFLLSLQTDNGSFKWVATDESGSAGMTAFALIALAHKTFPVKVLPPQPSPTAAAPRIYQADLVLSSDKTAFSGLTGDELVFTVSISNLGPDTATNVQVNNLLGDLSGGEVTVDTGMYDAETDIWGVGTLGLNQTGQAQIKLILPTAETYNWDITAAASEADTDLSNNTSTMTLTVAEPEVVVKEEAGPIQQAQDQGQVLGQAVSRCDLPDAAGEPNLSFRGYALKPTEGGDLWYFDPVGLKRYCLPDAEVTYQALGQFGLGITNTDLEKIPVAGEEPAAVDEKLVDKLRGRILLQVESVGEAWYVDPLTGQRHYLADGVAALNILTWLARTAPGKQIFPIPVGGLFMISVQGG